MLTPKAEKIRADIEVTCYKPEGAFARFLHTDSSDLLLGIDAIVAALRKGRDCETVEIPIKVLRPHRSLFLCPSFASLFVSYFQPLLTVECGLHLAVNPRGPWLSLNTKQQGRRELISFLCSGRDPASPCYGGLIDILFFAGFFVSFCAEHSFVSHCL